jgi:hypothetical protein
MTRPSTLRFMRSARTRIGHNPSAVTTPMDHHYRHRRVATGQGRNSTSVQSRPIITCGGELVTTPMPPDIPPFSHLNCR